ncbi:MAG: pseudouridine-5'-phosphate glycosidase, partial [Kutzneria sp.]|nr:pseudouridine-5'-phosphate glycosidase [Kutzneria sp.]
MPQTSGTPVRTAPRTTVGGCQLRGANVRTRPRVSTEVADTLAAGGAVVALESTLLAHGLPAGRNRVVADRVEAVVRAAGAVPATVAVLDGRLMVGLTPAQLDRVCDPDSNLVKLGRRDL